MNKRIIFTFLALIMLLMSSCSLAKPEEPTTAEITDRLVGVFITTEYLDLVDTDTWLSENIGNILNSENVTLPGEYAAQPRIYAELVDETIPGTSRITRSYQFKGLDGILLAEYTISVDNEPYRTIDSLGQIYDIHRTLKSLDNGSEIELTGSIYLCRSTATDIVFYFNPIYQTADGQVYLVPGDGMQAGPASSAYTLSSVITATEDSQTQSHSSKIEIKLECVEVAKRIVLIQMDKNNIELGRAEFSPVEMPDAFTPLDSAEYLIIESHYAESVSRSIHQLGCSPIRIFCAPENKICTLSETTVNWR